MDKEAAAGYMVDEQSYLVPPDSMQQYKKRRCTCTKVCKWVWLVILILVLIVTSCVITYTTTLDALITSLPEPQSVIAPSHNETGSATLAPAKSADDECFGTINNLPTLPNIDYSFYGYNILRGYPLADGVDPGFTHPIFRSDYSGERHTADCKYRMPGGIATSSDLSCHTLFSSNTLNSSHDLESSLSTHVHAEGGFFGAKFSASTDYQRSKSTLDQKSQKIIHSTARCQYFSAKLDQYTLPEFSSSFAAKLKQLFTNLERSDQVFEKKLLLEFIDYFGTHIPAKITYGARYTFESQLTSEKYQQLQQSKLSVEAQASYHGLFSIGGGASFTKSQSEAVSQFQEAAKISTFSVGSSPPNGGDVTKWAESVASSPIPVKYDLIPITDIIYVESLRQLDLDAPEWAVDALKAELLAVQGQLTPQIELGPASAKIANCECIFGWLITFCDALVEAGYGCRDVDAI